MARYAVIYFKIIDENFYEPIKEGKFKPNIIKFLPEAEPSILWCRKHENIGDDKSSTVIRVYVKEKDKYELDTQLISRAIKESEKHILTVENLKCINS